MKTLARMIRIPSAVFRALKRPVVKATFKSAGKHFRFDPDGVYLGAHLMEFGDHVFVGKGAYFSADRGIRVGNGVMLGPYPMIIGGDHNFSVVGKRMAAVHEGGVNQPVVIEDDVWAGARVLILKGVTIGEGSIVGAASVVTRSLPPYVIAYGNPCKPRKTRFTVTQLETHLTAVESTLTVREVTRLWEEHGLASARLE
jgi:acetyltransferase-like isoleucine patch superfamily enzyme